MPESPEVDALIGFVRARTVGHEIRSLDLEEYGALKTRGRPGDELAAAAVIGVSRRGKYLVLETTTATLVVGFGRAGWMRWVDPRRPVDAGGPPTIARLVFDDGAFEITDAGNWLSLGIWLVDDADDVPAIARLGQDPAAPDFTDDDLDRVLLGRRKQLRALLQEQESLAGIGGAYSDEILHRAGLAPLRHAATLDARERARLFDAVRAVLDEAFAARAGVAIDRLKAEKVASMRVHGRAGQTCPVCGGVIADLPGAKGAAQYCPGCQPG